MGRAELYAGFRVVIFEYLYAKDGTRKRGGWIKERGKDKKDGDLTDAAVLRVIPYQKRNIICPELCASCPT